MPRTWLFLVESLTPVGQMAAVPGGWVAACAGGPGQNTHSEGAHGGCPVARGIPRQGPLPARGLRPLVRAEASEKMVPNSMYGPLTIALTHAAFASLATPPLTCGCVCAEWPPALGTGFDQARQGCPRLQQSLRRDDEVHFGVCAQCTVPLLRLVAWVVIGTPSRSGG
jgi:hypothetical protein